MAICAAFRGRRVEEDLLSVDGTEKLVATGAGNVAVLTFECEGCPFVVIEQRRLPLSCVMAIGAQRNFIRKELAELASMHVLVAVFTLFGCLFEIHVDELGFQIRRLMAINTGYGSMRTSKRERRGIVIEAVQFAPGLGGVASLAAHRLPVLAKLGHALLELSVMNVLVTGGAGEIVEVIRDF